MQLPAMRGYFGSARGHQHADESRSLCVRLPSRQLLFTRAVFTRASSVDTSDAMQTALHDYPDLRINCPRLQLVGSNSSRSIECRAFAIRARAYVMVPSVTIFAGCCTLPTCVIPTRFLRNVAGALCELPD